MDTLAERIITPRPVVDGAGVRLLRSIGGPELDHADPFLLLDHFESDDPADYSAGFPMHPHRGIETVTYILDGEVDHRDTLGHEGCIGPGCAQWMTSGGGIMHEEMPRGRQGRLAGFQLWVNMPAALKMSPPRYQDVPASELPVVVGPGGVIVRVIAGEIDGVPGPVESLYAQPVYADVEVPPHTVYALPVKLGHTVLAYVFRGRGRFEMSPAGSMDTVDAPHLIVFGAGDEMLVETDDSAVRFLFITGAPLAESIARYGPFVMNTPEEIEQALSDLRNGTFVPGVASD
jgi:quercetin 2,3-dioxygenase